MVLMAKKRRKRSASSRQESYTDDDRDKILNDLIAKDVGARSGGSNLSSREMSPGEPTRTLSGGPSLIFEMARRMLVWDDELYQGLNDASRDGEDSLLSTALSDNANSSMYAPRWRPSPLLQRSISNVNPAFRTSSPIMTSAGYAGILRRNSRKKMKPSMWRHTLRVYDKMADLEKITIDGKAAESKKKAIRRKTVHHEAALVAASKLGMWEEAIKIYRSVEELPPMQTKQSKAVVGIGDGTTFVTREVNNTDDNADITRNSRRPVAVTDNMVLSVISACVKGSNVRRTSSIITSPVMNTTITMNATEFNSSSVVSVSAPRPKSGVMRLLSLDERRRPLDEARRILLSMEVS
jgi:hypothetical protein